MRDEHGKKHKNRNMKCMVIVLALLCALLSSGRTDACASSADPESQDRKTAEVSESFLHPVSSIEFMREWINEINQSDELMEQQGFHAVRKTLFMSFVEDDTPYTPIENIAAEGSGVHATVVMRVEEADSNESSVFSMTAVLLANGKPVNFRLNENSSREGILTVSLNSNQDYIMSLSAEDLPADEGENKLILVVFGYCKDQDFYLNPQSITGFFQSAVKNDGTSAVPCVENEIDIVTIQNRSELGQYARMDFLSDEEMTDVVKTVSSTSHSKFGTQYVQVTDLADGVYYGQIEGEEKVTKHYVAKGMIYLTDVAEDSDVIYHEETVGKRYPSKPKETGSMGQGCHC